MKLRNPIIALIALALLAPAAVAARDMDYPDREILRPLVIPMGYGEISGGFSWLQTERAFDNGGNREDMDARFTEMIYSMRIAGGIYRDLELQVGAPYIKREFTGSIDGGVEGFGDIDALLIYQIFRQTQRRPTSVVLGVRGIFPIGVSDARTFAEFTAGAPSRGTYAVGAVAMVREAYNNNIGVRYTFEWDFYLKGKQEIAGINADSDYGDIMRTSVEPTYQISDHVALWISTIYTKTFKSKFKEDGITIAEYPKSDLLEVRPALQVSLGHSFDVYVGTSWKSTGKNTFAGWPAWAEMKLRF